MHLVFEGLFDHHLQQVVSLDHYDPRSLQSTLAEEGLKVLKCKGVACRIVMRDHRGAEDKGAAGLVHTAEEERERVEARCGKSLMDP